MLLERIMNAVKDFRRRLVLQIIFEGFLVSRLLDLRYGVPTTRSVNSEISCYDLYLLSRTIFSKCLHITT